MSRNAYAGICYRCGKRVEPNEGHFERVGRSQLKKWGHKFHGKWLTQHAECAIEYRGTAHHWLFNPEPRQQMDAFERKQR